MRAINEKVYIFKKFEAKKECICGTKGYFIVCFS